MQSELQVGVMGVHLMILLPDTDLEESCSTAFLIFSCWASFFFCFRNSTCLQYLPLLVLMKDTIWGVMSRVVAVTFLVLIADRTTAVAS